MMDELLYVPWACRLWCLFCIKCISVGTSHMAGARGLRVGEAGAAPPGASHGIPALIRLTARLGCKQLSADSKNQTVF